MEIRHRRVPTGQITMHIAEAGQGPLVLLCHGFPEFWYSWRHQLAALAEAGYHAVAPDLRGYGETDRPSDIADYTALHGVGDMVGLLDALGIARAGAIVGHDMGCHTAWTAALVRPDRFPAVACLCVPWRKRSPVPPMPWIREHGLEKFYIAHFQTPGLAEAEFEADPHRTLRRVLYSFSGDVPSGYEPDLMVPDSGRWLDTMLDPPGPLAWLNEAELDLFAGTFGRTGFAGGINGYRNFDRNWALSAAWHDAAIAVPSLFIAGARDATTSRPAVREMIAEMAHTIPLVREPIFIDGAGHWVQQERPGAVSDALIAFLRQIGS